jgi:Protein of unknown function (DUF3305)
MSTPRPAVQVAVVMRKERVQGAAARWQTWRWVLDEVVAQQEGFGNEPRRLRADEDGESWLHPGFCVELFTDDVDGYLLNTTTDTPGWFVLWRMDEEAAQSDEPMARPVAVSLSYVDAGRWLDAQETVEQVPAPPDVLAWLRAFVDQHHVAEVKRRKRPESFRSLSDRFGNPASVSTTKGKPGGPHG